MKKTMKNREVNHENFANHMENLVYIRTGYSKKTLFNFRNLLTLRVPSLLIFVSFLLWALTLVL